MTRTIAALGIMTAAIASTGCSHQSAVSPNPVWVSKGINGLQRSKCNCGGVETKKLFRERKAAEAAAQDARHNEDGIK